MITNEYTHLLVIDSDKQHDPSKIQVFLSYRYDYDLIYGRRKKAISCTRVRMHARTHGVGAGMDEGAGAGTHAHARAHRCTRAPGNAHVSPTHTRKPHTQVHVCMRSRTRQGTRRIFAPAGIS